MKTWIKAFLRESLDEMKTKPKQPYDSGSYHNIYWTQKNPNVLYKVGSKGMVSEWVKVFQEYPQFFPKVYKVGRLPKNSDYFYVEIEKLDANRAVNEWQKLYVNFLDLGIFNPPLKKRNVYSMERYFGYIHKDAEYEKQISLLIKQKKPEIYDMYRRWADLILQIEVITQFELNKYADVHGRNFAYDTHGELKCIDI